jgi:hypothetical protein
MRTLQPNNHLFLLIFILAGLQGCSNRAGLIATESPSSTPFLQTGVALSKTPIAFPTGTNTPPATENITPLPTFTLTPLTTLGPTQAQEALQQLLRKQETCQSPCFWGIVPSKTALGEAQKIFNQLQIPLMHTLRKEQKDFYATGFSFKNGLGISIVFRVQNGLIDSLNMGIGLANDKASPAMREWLAFSPETMISQYGNPTYVEFSLPAAPSNGASPYIFYVMTMYFDSSNLIVEYDSSLFSRDEKLIRVCPLVDKFDGVRVWLGKDADNSPIKVGVPLERAASLTIAQFSNLMLQGSKKTACFDLSKVAFFSTP